MRSNDVQPGIWHYGLAIIIIIVGFIVFAGLIVTNVSDIGGSLTQFVVPGSLDLNITGPGEYTIFYENQTCFNGTFYKSHEDIPGLKISVLEITNGRLLVTYPPASDITYSVGGRSGRAIASFQAEGSGIYRINVSYIEESGPKVILAVGKGVLQDVFSLILVSIAILFGSMLIAGATVLVTYKRRKKAFDKLKDEERQMRGGA